MLPFLILLLVASCRSSPVEPQTVIAQPQRASDVQVKEVVKEEFTPVKEDVEDTPTRDARAFDNEVNQKVFTPANEESLMTKLNAKCSQRDASSCLMLKLVTYMNRLLKKSSIGVGDSLVITQTSAVVEEESPLSRSLQDDGSDESQLGLLIANKLWNFVRSRSIKWSVLPEADLVLSATPDDEGTLKLGMNIRAGKALETGRGKMKNMGPVIAAGIMKIGMVGVLAFKALVLLVGKALLVSKLAFLLAAVIGLKKLFSQERHVTYEVVAHPHHSHSEVHSSGHGHGAEAFSSGWGRSMDVAPPAAATVDPHSFVYSAYAPAP